ncbi:MAG: hypothetical protein ACRD44_06840 [Bryobacteraceae bacterium]
MELARNSALRPAVKLESWKLIAHHLGCGIRTAQRWEREAGLPVYRLRHRRRGGVYAFTHEIDEWWSRQQAQLIPSPNPRPWGRLREFVAKVTGLWR